jgi:hypothetical protein
VNVDLDNPPSRHLTDCMSGGARGFNERAKNLRGWPDHARVAEPSAKAQGRPTVDLLDGIVVTGPREAWLALDSAYVRRSSAGAAGSP